MDKTQENTEQKLLGSMSKKKSPQRRTPLRLVLPATSANLGPAFDAAAIAMDLYIQLDARPADEFSISASGRDHDICGKLEDHLIFSTYRQVLEGERKEVIPLSLRVRNDIPIGKGCGSSAAARVAGIALAVHFGRLGWTDARIVGEASHREHHPDNASACWMGGLTVARMWRESEPQIISLRPKGKWPLLLAVPEASLPTEEARRVLPAQYSRRCGVQHPKFHVVACRAHAGESPAIVYCARRPNSPALSRAALPAAALLAALEREEWFSRRGAQWRRPFGVGFPRSAY
jgi:homoserine kinase